jgi:anti-anti-sigma factor
MEILESRGEDAAVLHIIGRVNSSNAVLLEERLKRLIDAGCRGIIVDLARLDHMTSVGLRYLLRGDKQVADAGGKLVICGLQGLTRELFEVGGFLDMFTIAQTRDEAMRQMAATQHS